MFDQTFWVPKNKWDSREKIMLVTWYLRLAHPLAAIACSSVRKHLKVFDQTSNKPFYSFKVTIKP